MKNDKPRPTKKPCRICRKWYHPNPRARGWQKTCGLPDCKRQWKRRGQAQWSKNNPSYWAERRLREQLERLDDDDADPTSLARPAPLEKLPIELIRAQAGPLAATILLFSMRLLCRATQAEMKRQGDEISRDTRRLLQHSLQVAIDAKQAEITADIGGLLPPQPQVEIATTAAAP